MAANPKRVHYYHADSNAFGGHMETPLRQLLPVAAPSSLPPVGGYMSAHTDGYRLEGILSFESAHTQVAGSISHKTGGWTTLASAVVEGLNVLNVITADRVVAQIATEHPPDGYIPTVTFVGTHFQNLCVSGCELKPVLNLGICGQNVAAGQYPKKAALENDVFLKNTAAQYERMNTVDALPGWVQDRSIPAWVRERYAWDNAQLRERAAVACSLVTEVRGEFPGRPFGHVLEIPEIGRVFLGELLVDHNTYRIIGMRLELGCTTHASVSFSSPSIEGSSWP
ncbi:MAG TPA: hypothetical protein VF133_17570 [Terriglobales bacterium]